MDVIQFQKARIGMRVMTTAKTTVQAVSAS
jgi:hypothetical protein